MSQQMYRCVRVYNNGDVVAETLNWEDMIAWLNYNTMWRPGTALFVDDDCKQTGYLSHERCMELVQGQFKKVKPIPTNTDKRHI